MTTAINFKTNPEQLEKANSAKGRYKVVKEEGKVISWGQKLPTEVVDTFNKLPTLEERNQYILALSDKGWTHSAISNAIGKSRELVRQIVQQNELGEVTVSHPLPNPPRKVKTTKVYNEPTPELLARLKELQTPASLVRSHSPRYRAEAEEFAYLLNQALTIQNVTAYRLAKLLGVTVGAINFRLVRYGYKQSPNGKSKAYKPVLQKNRKA